MASLNYTSSYDDTSDDSQSPLKGRSSREESPQSQGELIIVSETDARSSKSAPAALQTGSLDDYSLLLQEHNLSSPQKPVTPTTPVTKPTTKQKTVHFETEPEFFEPTSRARKKSLDLKARLYDRPQDAQVFQTMRQGQQNGHTNALKNKQGAPLPPIPRPPSGSRVSGPGNTIRTTFFKRDQTRIRVRRQMAKKKESEEGVQKVPESPKDIGKDHLVTHDMPDDHPAKTTQKPPVPTVAAPDSIIEYRESPLHDPADVRDHERSAPRLSESRQLDTAGMESSIAPLSPLMQLAKKEFTPDPSEGSVKSQDATPRNMSPTGSQADASAVLTYLQTNLYDNTAPAVDSLSYHIRKMRRDLGLVIDLPRHGPGVKEVIPTLEMKLQEPEKTQDGVREYLEEIPKNKSQFVYALPRNRHDQRGRYNPYDLQVVSPNEARTSKLHFTASATFVTLHIEEGENEYDEITPTMQWQYERRLFSAINTQSVFVKFRIWKAFNVWKINVRAAKNATAKTIMKKQLFTVNEILQRCLLYVRAQCEAACCSMTGQGTREKAICLVALDNHKTLTLGEFCKNQANQCETAHLQLSRMREKFVKLAWECCVKVAEMEGINHKFHPGMGPLTKKVQLKRDKVDKSKKDDKSNGPTYTQIAQWRAILGRLAKFLHATDYVILDLLHRLVKTAVQLLREFLQMSISTGEELALKDEGSDSGSDAEGDRPKKKAGGFSRRLATLDLESRSSTPESARPEADEGSHGKKKVKGQPSKPPAEVPKYDFNKIEEKAQPVNIDQILDDLKRQEIVEMPPDPVFQIQLVLNVPPLQKHMSGPSNKKSGKHTRDRGKKKVVTFHESSSSSDDESSSSDSDSGHESESSSSSSDESKDGRTKQKPSKKYAYPVEHEKDTDQVQSKVTISLQPSREQFMSKVKGLIAGFEHTVGQVQALHRDPYLQVFWSPPRYDLKLSTMGMDDEEKHRPWPDLELLFGEDGEYGSSVTEVLQAVSENVNSVQEYAKNFEPYTGMVDQARRVDVEGSLQKREWTTEEFNHVLSAHSEMVNSMENMEKERRSGMIHVLVHNFQKTCLPYPTNVMVAVVRRLPQIANRRNENLLKVIKSASKKLDHMPQSVEEFVEHLSFLSRMGSELPSLEKEYFVVTRLFTIAKDFDVPIEPEELALYQTLMPSFQHLKSTIIYCEAKKDENISKFSDDLNIHIQGLLSEAYDIRNRVTAPTLLSADTLAVVAMENLKLLSDELNAVSGKARSYASYQDRFGSSISTQNKMKGISEEIMMSDYSDRSASAQQILSELSEIERELQLRKLLWESSDEWGNLVEDWTETQFDGLNVDIMQKNVSKFTQTVFMLEKGLPPNEVLPRLKERVLSFKQGMPVITALRNPALRPRHWQEIQNLIGRAIIRDKNFTLGKFLELQLFQYKDQINDISTTASNEATLEVMLNKVIDLWRVTDFRLVPHSGRDFSIIAGADDIMTQLEESQVTIGTIRGSRYVTPIKALVDEWDRKLNVFSRTLDEWMMCQRNWLYLEQIFTTPDIQRQLPTEAKLFASVDKSWKDIMRRTEDRPNALRCATLPGVLEILQTNNSNLEKIHKCLEDYLETKRLVFPRFYFLSNDDLLDILAQSKNPDAVQPHLVKCFGNIKSLEFQREPKLPPTVRAMISAEGEAIFLPKNVRARNPVEQWLGSVESAMFDSVRRNLKESVGKWGKDLEDWVMSHPGQVVLTVVQIMYNREVTASLEAHKASKALMESRDRLVDRLNILAGMVTKPLTHHKRNSVEALMVIMVHSRDIVNNLIDGKIRKSDDFEWTKQLRYQWEEQSNSCIAHQANASFQYGYEYLGCSLRLVITPLTDRCYLTLTGAMHMHLGGSPAGPAGTGKTETVKDLAKAVGKLCLVFNCSEGLDYKMMGKFFSGLSQSGSWCCFDEFNRIDVEVLSVIAQQLHSIKTAKDANALRFMFEGRDIRLNPTCGVFITMNPTYAGRVELPDNLKSLFRPVSMMVPDYALIAEIMLFSEGFTSARSLSNKIVNLYQLASKQLSQQDHYDFGMRAIKSVLVMAGQRKRKAQMESAESKPVSELEEAFILIHALRDANMPKFLAEDVPLFENILADLFPGIDPPQPDYGVLEKAISMAIRDLTLQHWPSQIEHVKQLHSQILVRHGVMLVGPSGGGKTSVRSILQRALVVLPTIHMEEGNEKGKTIMKTYGKKGRVDTFTLNPKCVKMGELYGQTDPNTLEWTDGLLASAVRKFSRENASHHLGGEDDSRPGTNISGTTRDMESMSGMTTPRSASRGPSPGGTSYPPSTSASQSIVMDSTTGGDSIRPVTEDRSEKMGHGAGEQTPNDWQWLVLDGPVDTLWVENLNTALDDSKLLCLANGERISLTPGMRLLFEVDNLSQASPATISRCAMVYLDPVDLGWRPSVKTWISKLSKDIPDSGKQHLQALFDKSLDKGLEFVQEYKGHQHVPASQTSMVNTLCNLLGAFLDFLGKNGGFGNPDEERPSSGESLLSSHSGRSSRSGTRRGSRKIKEKPKTQANKGNTKEWYLQKYPDQLLNMLGKIFVFCYVWSIGGVLRREDDSDDDGGISIGPTTGGGGGAGGGGKKTELVELNISYEFDGFVHDMFDTEPPLGVRLPSGSRTIFHYFVNLESGKFVPWDELVPSTKSLIDKGVVHVSLGEQLGVTNQMSKEASLEDGGQVPTVDTIRYSFLTSLLLLNKKPVLLTGDSGVGKSALISHMLKRLCKDKGTTTEHGSILGEVLNYSDRGTNILSNISALTSSVLNEEGMDAGGAMDLTFMTGQVKKQVTGLVSTTLQLSAQTSPARVTTQIQHKLIKKGKETMVGPRGKKVVVFVDDLNLPAPEQYGAQPPLELLRQFMELRGFYDTTKLAWKNILDVTLVAACAPIGGGRNPLSPRLLKHFCMLALPQPSTRSLQHIYQVQLGRFLENGDFLPDVKELLNPLVSASIAIYYKMCVNILPTPAKSHYTFNLRDLSKVILGLLLANETTVTSTESAAQLLAHEAMRVFHDRLVDDNDRMKFFEFLADDLHNYFKVKWSAEKLRDEPFLFGDFLDLNAPSAERIYRPINDYGKLASILEEFLVRINYSGGQLVFFREALEHIVRAARVFRQPGGHMVLVGLDGTGKSTTVQLACHVAGCELFKLMLTRGYGQSDFRDDLKTVFRKAGVKGINVVFLLTDSDIVKESFLEDINCVLNSGEVPDLFDNDDMEGIMMELKRVAQDAEMPDNREAVYGFFIQRVKSRLHIVIATSPAGEAFRQRCRSNPSLVNCCTFDWYDEWSTEAMLRVAHVFLMRADFKGILGDTDPETLKENIAQVCVGVHGDVTKESVRYYNEMRRHYYTTPSSYLDLIRLYSNMLGEQKGYFMNNKNRLGVGLSKLGEANSLVDAMQDELVALGPKIEEKAKDTELLLEQLSKDQEAVGQVRAIVEHEESIMKREAQIVEDYANQAQQDLQSVIPALQEAIDALDSLDKSDISEIRVYTKPPDLVNQVFAAVCVLFKQKPDWSTAKHLLADQGFLKKLVNFDKNNVPDKISRQVKKYTSLPDFIPEKVGQVSSACKSICQWVLALEHYVEVTKMVKPKQKRVEEAKEALNLAQEGLREKQESLSKIQDHLRVLQQQYDDSVHQRESLRERKVLTTLRLKRASVLIAALADEEVRWAESMDILEGKLQGVVGDTLVSASSIAYLGVFTASYRRGMINKWVDMCQSRGIPLSHDFTLIHSMAEPNVVRKWHNEGLPQDSHSTENAIFVKRGHRWPLMIDPQGQASKWICEMEGAALMRVQANDPNFIRDLERAVRIGEPVLLENVTEVLDPSLKPILLKEFVRRGAQDVIKLGDTEIEYNHNFRLYMTTSMANPHFLPAVCIRVTLINFTVTFEGLQDQLLSTVVQQEQPILEKQRGELLESIARDLTSLRDLEDKSLGLLQKSEGHILDDQDLVDTLEKSKKMSGEIQKRVAESEITQKKIEQARKKYLPVATRGAVLYFVLADLAAIDVMYQFSLPWFQMLFGKCIRDSSREGLASVGSSQRPGSGGSSGRPLSGRLRPSSARNSPDLSRQSVSGRDSPNLSRGSSRHALQGKDLMRHLQSMVRNLTETIYKVVSVALFNHHQLVFSFMLCSSIMLSNGRIESNDHDEVGGNMGRISQAEWQVFLQGQVLAETADPLVLEKHDGLTPMQRLELESRGGSAKSSRPGSSTSSIGSRTGLTGHITSRPPKWIPEKAWKQCQYLSSTLEPFQGICMYILNCHDQWMTFAKVEDPYRLMTEPFVKKTSATKDPSPGPTPGPTPSGGNPFSWEILKPIERLLLIKVLRPDSLVASVRAFVNELMGDKFLSSGGFDLKEIFEGSTAVNPLIFILSPGVDPTAQLMRFARDMRGSTLHVDLISLGRGQGPKAEELISKAQILKGRWIFLQNCHLAASFMPRLQDIVEGFSKPNVEIDPQFRLWLSSKPDPSFPASILQTGLKMTVESPQGLKANLLRSFGGGGAGAITEEMWEDSAPGENWRSLVFGLCFFNAIINERKKYGALGWNIPHAFNASDFEVSVQLLKMLLVLHEDTPWEALMYLTGEVVYGGRVTDNWDRRCLLSILNTFYCKEALLPEYCYSPDKIYHPLPKGFSLTSCQTYIEGLPEADRPEVFGMHPNAEKAYRESEAQKLVNTLLTVQPRVSMQIMGTGKTSDEIVLELAEEIQRHLPESIQSDTGEPEKLRGLSRKQAKDEPGAGGGMFPGFNMAGGGGFGAGKKQDNKVSTPVVKPSEEPQTPSALLTILRQEIDRFNRLLGVIHTSLTSLALAIKGEVVMSDQLEEMFKALLSQRVPRAWQQAAYESCKPLGSWGIDLQQRVDFFSRWSDLIIAAKERKEKALGAQGQAPMEPEDVENLREQPRSFWLPGFFFPQGFLTAVQQNHARREGVSVDSLTFDFRIMTTNDDTEESLSNVKQDVNIRESAFKGSNPPSDGVLVFGLFLDGARFDPFNHTIKDSRPEERFCRLPEVHFIPTQIPPEGMIPPTPSTSAPTPTPPQSATSSVRRRNYPVYECPLYRTSARSGTLSSTGLSTNFVTSIDLPTEQSPDFWIRRGVALLCQLDD
ncbi:dynein axonemal heavy chain 6-like isoform X2 [Lytechinus pictus]|uniref:dynein axonemal heavy chain 6-like isoform X2 n=1 Tax=Lytechinus pictus TaxID=7653 RepID=UPI0030BA07DB